LESKRPNILSYREKRQQWLKRLRESIVHPIGETVERKGYLNKRITAKNRMLAATFG